MLLQSASSVSSVPFAQIKGSRGQELLSENRAMQSREELHKLVDSMPEGAIETARQVLTLFQVWPPQMPPQVEEMRQVLEGRLKEVQESHSGMNSVIGIPGGCMEWPNDQSTGRLRSGYWSFDHLDGETLVVETRRYKDGHELSVIERIRVEGGHLTYKHEITGPGASAMSARSRSRLRKVLRHKTLSRLRVGVSASAGTNLSE
jgi:hypothetical protein